MEKTWFVKQMQRLADTFGKDVYGKTRLEIFWDRYGKEHPQVFGDAITEMIATQRFPPLAKEFDETMAGIKTRNGIAAIQKYFTPIECKECDGMGAHIGPNGVVFCDCSHGETAKAKFNGNVVPIGGRG